MTASRPKRTWKKEPEIIRWAPECQQSFDQLKEVLTTGPVYSAPDYSQEFIIFTDASNGGLGEVQCQADDSGSMQDLDFVIHGVRRTQSVDAGTLPRKPND